MESLRALLLRLLFDSKNPDAQQRRVGWYIFWAVVIGGLIILWVYIPSIISAVGTAIFEGLASLGRMIAPPPTPTPIPVPVVPSPSPIPR